MPIEWIGFLLFTASIVGTPGPSNMVLMAAGARFGFVQSRPFLAGVILGKQFIIWPIGLGLLTILSPDGVVFQALRWASIAYILWLAWKVSLARISPAEPGEAAPGFMHGLVVHPLNPKAWALILGVFTNFVGADAQPLAATFGVALGIIAVQCVLQPLWMLAGVQIAKFLAGTPGEAWLMRAMAVLMVGSVLYVLLKGV